MSIAMDYAMNVGWNHPVLPMEADSIDEYGDGGELASEILRQIAARSSGGRGDEKIVGDLGADTRRQSVQSVH